MTIPILRFGDRGSPLDGCPIAIEVFEGNTADPMTLATQIENLKQCFTWGTLFWSATAA